MPKKVIEWETKDKAKITKNSVQFLDKHGAKFKWGNTTLTDLQLVKNGPEKLKKSYRTNGYCRKIN